MLQPLQVAAPPSPHRNAALTKICAIEHVRCVRKTKRNGASLYVIDLYFQASSSSPRNNPMLSSTWRAEASGAASIGNRAPDASVARPYLEAWTLAQALLKVASNCQLESASRPTTACRICKSMTAYIKNMERAPLRLGRVLWSSAIKQRQVEEVVGTYVAIVVRAQYAPAPNAVRAPCCANEATIAELLGAFLGLC